MEEKQVGFIVAAKSFFGFKDNQTLMEFREEFSQLTAKDKEEIRQGLIKAGFNVSPLKE